MYVLMPALVGSVTMALLWMLAVAVSVIVAVLWMLAVAGFVTVASLVIEVVLWMLAVVGSMIVVVLRGIWRSILGDQEQVEVYHATTAEREKWPLSGSSFFRSGSPSFRVNTPTTPNLSGYNNNKHQCHTAYCDCYPYISASTTTKRSSVASQQSGDGNSKSAEGTKPPPLSDQSTEDKAEAKAKSLASGSTTTKRSTVASQHSGDGNSKSARGTKPQPSSDQSTKTKAEDKAKPAASAGTKKKSSSVAAQHSGDGNIKSTKGSKPPPLPDQSTKAKADTEAEAEAEAKAMAIAAASPSSSKRTLSRLPCNSTDQQTKANYIWVNQKGELPIYMIPKDIESLLKKNLVPDVLKKPLSPSTYKDYFAALLYAEDFCAEKRRDFQLLNVTLELHEAAIYDPPVKKKSAQTDDKIFVAFEIYSQVLLSRDFVFVRRSGSKNKKFQGIVYRVAKSNMVLVEFEEEFYAQHDRNRKYDVSFSFSRVCLKRAHQAISAASRGLFKHYLFPNNAIRKKIPFSISGSIRCVYNNSVLDMNSNYAVHQILSFRGYPPYLVEGPLCVDSDGGINNLSKTGRVVQEAILQIYQRSSSNCRILICSPLNSTGDILLRSLKEHKIPESVMFRANAAFREVDGVPIDILPTCAHDGKCFSLPSLGELKQFRVIFSTFATSFRLLDHGITAGHFSHIFLVDSSSATEPETIIPLSSFAIKNTTVVITGAPDNHPSWVHSDIAGNNGLRMSYFERLRATNIYSTSDPAFITQL